MRRQARLHGVQAVYGVRVQGYARTGRAATGATAAGLAVGDVPGGGERVQQADERVVAGVAGELPAGAGDT